MLRYTLTIALLILTAVAGYSFSRPGIELHRRPLSEFPKVIGDWKAIGDHFIDDASMSVLLVDDYTMRTYKNPKGETVGLYIGYFKNQRKGKQIHSPRQCLPGAGWGIIEQKVYRLKIDRNNTLEVPINYYIMGKGAYKDLYLWWYQGRGRIYANEYLNKLYLILDSITKHRTDGALVRINMQIKSDHDQSLNTQLEFISLLTPILAKYIPG